MLRKLFSRKEETADELGLRLREERMNSSIKDFYKYRKEMNETIAKYDYSDAKEQAQRRADIMMGLAVEMAIDAALDHRNKRHIHTCWKGREN